MRRLSLFQLVTILLLAGFSSCTAQPTGNQRNTVTPDLASVAVSPAESNDMSEVYATTPTPTSTPTLLVPTPAPTQAVTPTDVPITLPTTTTRTANSNGCPVLDGSGSALQQLDGAILFEVGDLVPDLSHISESPASEPWIISASAPVSQLATGLPVADFAPDFVSPDGTTLIRFERTDDGGHSPQGLVIFHNLMTGEESSVAVPSTVVQELDWLPDGRFIYLSELERTLQTGEVRQYIILDSRTHQLETLVEELDLPGYLYNPLDQLPSGYSSLEPKGELVLYTAEAEELVEVRVLLLDRRTGVNVWEGTSYGLPGYPRPVWASDGSSVLFVLPTFLAENGYPYGKIVSLTREGKEEELPPQPFPGTEENSIRYLTLSPSGRYIIYGLWDSATIGPGYMVDTTTGQVREICVPGSIFIDGQWVSDNLFAFRALIREGEEWRHSLHLLDVPSWTVQMLFESEPGDGVWILGRMSLDS